MEINKSSRPDAGVKSEEQVFKQFQSAAHAPRTSTPKRRIIRRMAKVNRMLDPETFKLAGFRSLPGTAADLGRRLCYGEEAYSPAICLREPLEDKAASWEA